MSEAPDTGQVGSAVRFDRDSTLRALRVSVRAPSIHNTQPWRWRLDGNGLALLADRTRQLTVADPDGHSLLLSCGAALTLTEIALRAQGWRFETRVLPRPDEPDLLAELVPREHGQRDEQAGELVDAALRRRSDRRPFAPDPVSDQQRDALRAAVGGSGVSVDFPDSPDRHVELAVAVSWADRAERNDEAYLAEMHRWLRDPEVHALVDGVPIDVIPHVPPGRPRHTDVPLRDFEVGVTGGQLIERDVDERPLIVVLLTASDIPRDHLSAGAAMMRIMLQADLLGLATCPLSQAVDFAAFRTRLQERMGWVGYPQMMLRTGRPSAAVTLLPLTPRRAAEAVLDMAD